MRLVAISFSLKPPDDLIVAARHTLRKSILDESDVSKVFSRWSDHLTFAGINQKVRSRTTAAQDNIVLRLRTIV